MTIELINENSRLGLDSHGAKIQELQLDGNLILGTFLRSDGKSSATHPCSPIFGPETTTHYGLVQHGSARTTEWEVTEQSKSDATLSCAIHQGTYPDGIVLSQTFRLSPSSLSIETCHTNQGQTTAPVQFAEHCYWNAPKGWQEAKLNNTPLSSLIKTNDSIPVKEQNRLVIPSLPDIQLEQTGLPIAILWTQHNEISNQWDQNYFCLEPAEGPIRSDYFGSPGSLIAPGQSRTVMMTISILS